MPAIPLLAKLPEVAMPDAQLTSALSHFSTHFNGYIDDLMACLKIPSISALPAHQSDMVNCANHLASHITAIGLKNVQLLNHNDHPSMVYADYIVDSKKPTLLFYGHYDVQPVDPLDKWESPPFEPEIRHDAIYARGASDNKGMFYAQLKALESYLKTSGTLPINVKVIIEGEEEIGSKGLVSGLTKFKDLLKHDALVVSDSPMFSESQASICTGFRGLIYLECHVNAMNHDVHSGQMGGGVPNVIHYCSQCIASMKDPKTNVILIPGFYDDVLAHPPFNATQPVALAHLSQLDDHYRLSDHANNAFFDNIWYRPTLDCNGISSGYINEGSKTVIPNTAMFKLSCRLVPNQDPKRIIRLVSGYIQDFFPSSFNVRVTSLGPLAKAAHVDEKNPYIQAAIQSLETTHKMPIICHGEGGSVPILAEFQDQFNTPLVLIGLNAPNDNIHAPNERFRVSHYKNAIETYIRYLYQIDHSQLNQ